ncbi:MAG: FAD/NAD(P)-binding protein [Bacillota bacterium]
MSLRNPYHPIPMIVRRLIQETPSIKSLVLEPLEAFRFEAGQFVELTVPLVGEAPFTPSSSPYVENELEVTIMRVGKVTDALHELAPGERIGLRGPLGKGYPLDEFKGKDLLIVGGGVGMAPLRSLILTLLRKRNDYGNLILCYGARTPKDVVYRSLLEKWQMGGEIDVRLAVDVGDATWKGKVGVVTVLLDDIDIKAMSLEKRAIVCGPPMMMRFTTMKLLEIGFVRDQILLSMERNMSCGIGKCGHCMIGRYYVCLDGPVLRYSDIQQYGNIFE